MTNNELLKILKLAVKLTREAIPYSSNLSYRDDSGWTHHRNLCIKMLRHRAKTLEQKALVNEIFKWNLDISSEKERYPHNSSSFWVATKESYYTLAELTRLIKEFPRHARKKRDYLQWTEYQATKAFKYGIGNCSETSAYTLLLLMEYPEEGIGKLAKVDREILIERIAFPKDDHVLLAVGRNKKVPVENILDYDDKTIFVDPWTGEVYTKEELFLNKNKEEKEFIVNMFKQAQLIELTQQKDCFIGQQYNKEIHSEKWLKTHGTKKYWRPKRLIDAVPPKRVEQLPKVIMGNTFVDINDVKQLEKVVSNFGQNKKMTNFYGVYNKDEIVKALNQFQKLLNESFYHDPVKIVLESVSSNIEVFYHMNIWVIKNGNDIIKFKDPIEVTNNLIHYFGNSQNMALSWEIYGTSKARVSLLESIKEWELFKAFQSIDLNNTILIDDNNVHLIHLAALCNDVEMIKKLLTHGVNINASANEVSPLHLALKNRYLETVKFLLAQGATPCPEIVLDAIKNENVLAVKQLIKFIVPNEALRVAITNKSVMMVYTLLNEGLPPQAEDFELAIQLNYSMILKMLLTKCKDVPVSFLITKAIEWNQKEILNYLFEDEVVIPKYIQNEQNPLYMAILGEKVELIEILINHGFDEIPIIVTLEQFNTLKEMYDQMPECTATPEGVSIMPFNFALALQNDEVISQFPQKTPSLSI